MFRTALRTATRQSIPKTFRRNVSTEPPHLKSRSWKNSALRWGLAGAGVYYYNTSPVFAEHPQSNLLNPDLDAEDDNALDRLLESSKVQSPRNTSTLQSAIERGSEKAAEQTQENHDALQSNSTHSVTSGASDLEEEAAGEGAFNPETGEINWDCPCLGGMAYGPCGEEFRTAFSCFVYSTEEPKGMDCVEKFGAMQDCFRAHPEVYQGELDEDGDGEMTEEKEELKREIEERRGQVQQAQKEKTGDEKQTPQATAKTSSHTPEEYSAEKEVESPGKSRVVREPKTKGTDAAAVPESESLVPKAAHDASSASHGMSVAR